MQEREEGYYWCKFGEWIICYYVWDDESENYNWYADGMQLGATPKEINETRILPPE